MSNQVEPIIQQDDPNSIVILQINLNKSEKAHLDIINEDVSQKIRHHADTGTIYYDIQHD